MARLELQFYIKSYLRVLQLENEELLVWQEFYYIIDGKALKERVMYNGSVIK